MIIINNKIDNPNIVNIFVPNPENILCIGIQSRDGRVRNLVNEQIASFVELAVNGGGIDKVTADKIRDIFKHIIPDLSNQNCFSLEVLREKYNSLYMEIEKHILKANKNGKKVLILVGEDHFNRKSLILELMILDITNKLSVNTLLTETTNELLEIIKNSALDEITSPNYSFILNFAEELNFETISCDPEQFNKLEKV